MRCIFKHPLKSLWNEIFEMMELAWEMPKHVMDLLGCWQDFGVEMLSKK